MLCWEAAGSGRETEEGSSTGYLLGEEGMCRMLMLGPGEKSQHLSSSSYLVVAPALSCMVCTALSGDPHL